MGGRQVNRGRERSQSVLIRAPGHGHSHSNSQGESSNASWETIEGCPLSARSNFSERSLSTRSQASSTTTRRGDARVRPYPQIRGDMTPSVLRSRGQRTRKEYGHVPGLISASTVDGHFPPYFGIEGFGLPTYDLGGYGGSNMEGREESVVHRMGMVEVTDHHIIPSPLQAIHPHHSFSPTAMSMAASRSRGSTPLLSHSDAISPVATSFSPTPSLARSTHATSSFSSYGETIITRMTGSYHSLAGEMSSHIPENTLPPIRDPLVRQGEDREEVEEEDDDGQSEFEPAGADVQPTVPIKKMGINNLLL